MSRVMAKWQIVALVLLEFCFLPFAFAGNCSIFTIQGINFASYSVFNSSSTSSQGSVSVSCDPPTSYTLTITDYNGVGAHDRFLQGPGNNVLNYTLSIGSLQNSETTPISAEIASLQDVSVGSYSDSIPIEVAF